MASLKRMSVGAINITIQPHSEKKYVDLFKAAFKLKRVVKLNSTSGALLAGVRSYPWCDDSIKPVTGDIWRFTQIDTDAPWINIETNDIATDDDKESLNIPPNLRPNGSRFSYIFYPDKHMLFYESYYDKKTLGPTVATDFFNKLFSQEEIVEKFGEVEVTHLPDINGLEEALNIPFKRSIETVFKKPNPDSFAKEEAAFLNRMKKNKVQRIEQKFIADAEQSIEVDDGLKVLAHIAAKNGSLKIKGRDHASKPIEYSTVSQPFKETEMYDPSEESMPIAFMYRMTSKLKTILSNKLSK
ncbi:hypothetical protein OA92_23165 [Marinomonas sp. SBI22]|uniref:DUF4747 family protein n=1 Tax=unclassified Marinomonas TaxID=196814 RepID=UPI0007AFDCB1|nr:MULTISPECIES: DUF4747 family protein [unclassified Marinomonas]KZM38565.1 hypothetical protein OA92_23165 [Marinomonas sp. SBI22]KZM41950.1 hypothetical protein OA91_15995 [Marinomonas sp. SBI8L]